MRYFHPEISEKFNVFNNFTGNLSEVQSPFPHLFFLGFTLETVGVLTDVEIYGLFVLNIFIVLKGWLMSTLLN